MPDLDFIHGIRTESFVTQVNSESGTVEHYFEITKGNETRKFKPFEFLNLILEAYYEAADKTKNHKRKLAALANAESDIVRLIQENGLNSGDFSNIFSDIDITRRRLNAYVFVNEKRNDWLRAIGAVCIGVILTALLSYITSHPQYIRTTVVIPKTDTVYQIIHDTIFIQNK